MRPFALPLLASILAFALATPALALDEVILADGTFHRAEILEVLPDAIRVRFSPKSGGTAEMKFPASQLDAHYFYNLADSKLGDDAKARLKLALWCVDEGLFSRARIQIDKAAALDPQLVQDIREGKLPEIREGIAKHVLESAEKDVRKKDYDLAEKKLQALLARMPDTEAGTAAVKVYDDLQVTMEEVQAKQEQEALDKMAEEEQKKEKELRKRIEPIKKDIDEGKKFLNEGLTEDSEQQALKDLDRAIAKGAEAMKKIDKLLAEYPDDADLQQRGQEVKDRIVAAMVNAHIQRSDIYVWRGSTKQARDEIKEARELDPENPNLAAAEQRIWDRDNQSAIELGWQRNRRAGYRFRSGSIARGGRVGIGGRR